MMEATIFYPPKYQDHPSTTGLCVVAFGRGFGRGVHIVFCRQIVFIAVTFLAPPIKCEYRV